MKTIIITTLLALLGLGLSTVNAQNGYNRFRGLPGDNLNLFAVMNLFQNSETLEEFERNLNDPATIVNNLDLNRDNLVDYIMVFDYKMGNTHNIVLRVAINRFEFQDVAVFIVQEFMTGTVQIQLIGDEALYGPGFIIEPHYVQTPNPGYRGNIHRNEVRNLAVVHTTYYDVAFWPVVVYITRPTYVVWRSGWHWGYRPAWWNPWRPHYWHFYHGYHYNWSAFYHRHFHPCDRHRNIIITNYYITNIRNYSPTVALNVNQGNYMNTYSRPETRVDGEKLYTQNQSITPGTEASPNPRPQARSERGQVSRGEESSQLKNDIIRGNTPTTTSERQNNLTTERRISNQAPVSVRNEPKGRYAGYDQLTRSRRSVSGGSNNAGSEVKTGSGGAIINDELPARSSGRR